MGVYGNPNKGPTAELTRTLAALRAADRPARQHAGATRRWLARSTGRTRSPATWPTMTAQFTSTGARLDTRAARHEPGARAPSASSRPTPGSTTDMRELSQSMKELLDELSEASGEDSGDGQDLLERTVSR